MVQYIYIYLDFLDEILTLVKTVGKLRSLKFPSFSLLLLITLLMLFLLSFPHALCRAMRWSSLSRWIIHRECSLLTTQDEEAPELMLPSLIMAFL